MINHLGLHFEWRSPTRDRQLSTSTSQLRGCWAIGGWAKMLSYPEVAPFYKRSQWHLFGGIQILGLSIGAGVMFPSWRKPTRTSPQ